MHVCTISSVAYIQVNGLPTNQAFLKRLTEHPSFQAAELDTSFIQKHHASLTDTEAPAKHVVALAAVADHLVQVQQVHTLQCHSFFVPVCLFVKNQIASLTKTQAPAQHVVALATIADHLVQGQQVQCRISLRKCM